jgi:predicted ATP-dependent endonuclease of OLD family
MISTRVRCEEIDHLDILIFDEPDQSLYPSSIRFLRDELLKLSEKTKIIFSTHSQYMIDTENIERHYIVDKIDDITKIDNDFSKSQFSNCELLRNAIGTSVFECLKEKNLIFEGWLDKKLFDLFLMWNPNYVRKFKDVGKTYLSGISGAEQMVQIMQLASKKFIIIADSDQTSRNKRLDFNNNYPEEENNWIGYAEIDDKIETMEDFLEMDYVKSQLSINYNISKFDEKISAIKNIEKIISDKTEKQIFKKTLMSNLKHENIKKEYEDFVKILVKKFE